MVAASAWRPRSPLGGAGERPVRTLKCHRPFLDCAGSLHPCGVSPSVPVMPLTRLPPTPALPRKPSRVGVRCVAPWAALVALALLPALAGCGGADPKAGTQVAAQVNDSEISIHQVNHVLQQRGGGVPPEQARAAGRLALDGLIEQELAVQAALALKLDREPAVMQDLAAVRRDALARAWVARMQQAVAAPEADAVRQFYDTRPQQFAKRRVFELQELVVPATPAQQAWLRDRLAQARKVDDVLAALRSQGLAVQTSRSTQGAESMQPALVERLLQMKDGQAVLMAAPGAARMVVLQSSREMPLSFEQARPAIEQALLAERRRDAVRSGLQSLRRSALVQYRGAFADADAAAASAAASATAASMQAAAPAPLSTAASSPATPAPAASAATTDAESTRKGLAGLR